MRFQTAFLCLCSFFFVCQCTDIYVAVDGVGGANSTTCGRTPGNPCSSLVSAISAVRIDGTVWVAPGTYTGGTHCGVQTSASSLTVRNIEDSSSRPIVDCNGVGRFITIVPNPTPSAGSVAVSIIGLILRHGNVAMVESAPAALTTGENEIIDQQKSRQTSRNVLDAQQVADETLNADSVQQSLDTGMVWHDTFLFHRSLHAASSDVDDAVVGNVKETRTSIAAPQFMSPIYAGGLIRVGSGCSLTLSDCELAESSAELGGCIAALDASVVRVVNSNIGHCTAKHGGGVYIHGGTVSISDGSNIFDNSVVNGGAASFAGFKPNAALGGGVFIGGSAVVSIADSAIGPNNVARAVETEGTRVAYSMGGGMLVTEAADVTLTGVIVHGNRVSSPVEGYGGGLYIDGHGVIQSSMSPCRVRLHGSNVTNNSASAFHWATGGGIGGFMSPSWATGTQLPVDMSSGTTLTDNSAVCLPSTLQGRTFESNARGGGLYCWGCDVRMSTTTIQGNVVSCTASQGRSCNSGGAGYAIFESVVHVQHCRVALNTGRSIGANTNAQGSTIALWTVSTIEETVYPWNTVQCDGSFCSAWGGGIVSDLGSAYVANSSVIGNTVTCNGDGCTSFGGGLRSFRGTNVIVDTMVLENKVACVAVGACVSAGGGLSFELSATSINSTAAVANSVHCTGYQCVADGGGIATESNPDTDGSMTLSDVRVLDNVVTAEGDGCTGRGGGMLLSSENVFIGNVVEVKGNRVENKPAPTTETETETATTTTQCTTFNASNPIQGSIRSACGSLVLIPYLPEMDAQWKIEVPSPPAPYAVLRLSITFLNTELSFNCGRDRVSFYDGESLSSTLLGSYCGQLDHHDEDDARTPHCYGGVCAPHTDIVSSGAVIVVRFQSNLFDTRTGFTVHWSSVVERVLGDKPQVAPTRFAMSRYGVARGGGIALSGGSINPLTSSPVRLSVSHNAAASPFLAAGGGIDISLGTVSEIGFSIFHNEAHAGSTAFGGGVAVWEGRVILASTATTNVSLFDVSENTANATGVCFFDSLSGVQCAASAGGGLASGGGAVVVLGSGVAATFRDNTARCSGRSCVALGGGTSVRARARFHEWSLIGSHVKWSHNRAECASVGCTATGGALVIDSSSSDVVTASLSHSHFVSNGVYAMDFALDVVAGGVALLREASVSMSGCVVERNVAAQGGGVWLSDWSKGNLTNVTIRSNIASGQGGGIALLGSSTADVHNSTLSQNKALLANEIFSSGSVQINLVNTIVRSGSSSHATLEADKIAQDTASGVQASLTLASVSGRSVDIIGDSTVWMCGVDGTDLIAAQTSTEHGQVTTIRCDRCKAGTYKLWPGSSTDSRPCRPCPEAAICLNGGDQVRPEIGFWGALIDDSSDLGGGTENLVLSFDPCPPGYCCPDAETACRYNHCDGGRTGRLCGKCIEGMSEAFGSTLCVDDEECSGNALYYLVLGFILIGILMGWLVKTWNTATAKNKDRIRREQGQQHMKRAGGTDTNAEAIPQALEATPDGAELKCVTFYYQLLPAVLSPITRNHQDALSRFLLACFNLQFDQSAGGASGFCPYVGFTAVEKMGMRYVLPGMFILWAGIMFVVQWSCIQFVVRQKKRQGTWQRDRRVLYHGYAGNFRALFMTFGFCYSALLTASFDLISCAQVGSDLVLFSAGSIECYQSWQIALMIIVLPILVLYPVGLFCLVFVFSRRERVGSSMQGILYNVARAYRPSARQWESILMAERLFFALVGTLVLDRFVRAWLVAFGCVVALALHLTMRPFKRVVPNALLTTLVLFLSIVSLWELGIAFRLTKAGAPGRVDEATDAAFFQLVGVCTTLPSMFGCIYFVVKMSRLLPQSVTSRVEALVPTAARSVFTRLRYLSERQVSTGCATAGAVSKKPANDSTELTLLASVGDPALGTALGSHAQRCVPPAHDASVHQQSTDGNNDNGQYLVMC